MVAWSLNSFVFVLPDFKISKHVVLGFRYVYENIKTISLAFQLILTINMAEILPMIDIFSPV